MRMRTGHSCFRAPDGTSGGVHCARVATLVSASRNSLGHRCKACGRPFDFEGRGKGSCGCKG
eukprot:2698628-Pleurochrysis_carterae.AAC.1